MTDWKQHDGGPQPVADDVWVSLQQDPDYTSAWQAHTISWQRQRGYRVLNQHLIDAARLEGIRLGLEAAFRAMLAQFFDQAMGPPKWHMLGESINALDPETIAKEADQ